MRGFLWSKLRSSDDHPSSCCHMQERVSLQGCCVGRYWSPGLEFGGVLLHARTAFHRMHPSKVRWLVDYI